MLTLKFVPAAAWATQPFLGPQIVVIDEQNRLGFWGGSAYSLPGSGGGGSSGGGGGDTSIVEVSAVNAAGDLATFKRAGMLNAATNVVRTYLPDGVTPANDKTFGTLAQLDWQEDLGFLVADPASNIYMPAAPMSVSWAQAIFIGDAIIAGTYAVDDGYPIYVRDKFNGFVMLWDNTLNWWSPPGHRKLLGKALNEATAFDPTADNQESGDRYSLALPGRMLAPNGGKIICNSLCQHTGANGLKTHRWYLDATQFYSSSVGATSSLSTKQEGAWIANFGSVTAQRYQSNVSFGGGGLGSIQTSAVDTSVDKTISFRHFMASNLDTAKYDLLEVWLEQ